MNLLEGFEFREIEFLFLRGLGFLLLTNQFVHTIGDDFQIGDKALFYHSSCAVPAVVGTAVVVRSGYPDHTAWDKNADYFDPKSSEDNPRWYMVDVQLTKKLTRPVTLAEMRTSTELEDMALLRKGNRLSIQPVTAKEFSHVLKMALSRVT